MVLAYDLLEDLFNASTMLFCTYLLLNQIVKKMLESSQFLSSEQPSEPKSLDVALNIARVEKILLGNLRLQSTRRPFDSSFERKEASVTVEICVLCGR